jgi:hypothetical protein
MKIPKTRLHTDSLLLRMVIDDLESLLGVKGASSITSLVLQAWGKVDELERSGVVIDESPLERSAAIGARSSSPSTA